MPESRKKANVNNLIDNPCRLEISANNIIMLFEYGYKQSYQIRIDTCSVQPIKLCDN